MLILYLSGIIIAFFLALVLLTKKHKTQADYILFAWIVMLAFHLLTFYILFTEQYATYPTLAGLGLPLPLLHGPFLYLYTHQQTSSRPFKARQLLHFLPVLLSYVSFSSYYLLSAQQKQEVLLNEGQGFELPLQLNLYAIYASGIIYVTLSLIRILKYRRDMVQQFSNTEKINFNWLLYLIFWIVAIWVVILLGGKDELIYGAASLFVLWLGYFGIKQVQVFTQNTPQIQLTSVSPPHSSPSVIADRIVDDEPEIMATSGIDTYLKYQKSTLSEEEAEDIHRRLRQLMAEQKPYKNPDLTLNELAKSLDVHPNYLSQVINSKENKSFYDLVNEMRVNAFIKNISQPISQQYTLLAIAFDCGFNSKASFNRNFKKYTGHTPSDYLKLQPAK